MKGLEEKIEPILKCNIWVEKLLITYFFFKYTSLLFQIYLHITTEVSFHKYLKINLMGHKITI